MGRQTVLSPGQHGQARRKRSEYAIRLEEKQKLRFNYGMSERQLVRYVKKARAQDGNGNNLLKLLENRLDNVCFRLGFGPTIPGARQLVNHGHVTVNGRVVDIAPSYQCKAGDVIAIREKKPSKLAKPTWNSRSGQHPPPSNSRRASSPPRWLASASANGSPSRSTNCWWWILLPQGLINRLKAKQQSPSMAGIFFVPCHCTTAKRWSQRVKANNSSFPTKTLSLGFKRTVAKP